jgi:hypothetical protein
MNSFDKFMYAVYLLIFIIVLLIINTDSVFDSRCYNYNKFLSVYADGRVRMKYIDSSNHNMRIIEIENFNGSKSKLDLTYNWNSYIYDSLKEGYLIKKIATDPKVEYGKDSLEYIIYVDFNCDSLSK